MTDALDIFLLSPDRELRDRLAPALAGVTVCDAPLEALAELATPAADAAAARRVLVATPDALGYRHHDILSAVAAIEPRPAVFLAAAPEDEPRAAEMATDGADDYFVLPAGLAALTRALAALEPQHTIPLPGRRAATAQPPAASADHADRLADCLSKLAAAAHLLPETLARAGCDAVMQCDDITGVALLEAARPPLWIVAVGDGADPNAATEALADPDLQAGSFLSAGDHQWIYLSPADQRPRRALLVRARSDAGWSQPPAAIESVARVFLALENAARQREAAVKVLATDPQTGLASRRYLEHYLAALCRRAAESHAEVALVLFAPRGDNGAVHATLGPLAELMRQKLAAAKLARLAPDTLAAVFTGSDAADAALRARIDDFARLITHASLMLPVAIGGAVFPWHAPSPDALISLAGARLERSRRRTCGPILS